VTAKRKEAIINTDSLGAGDFSKQSAEQVFCVVARCTVILRAGLEVGIG
jgi:hypothetical protein